MRYSPSIVPGPDDSEIYLLLSDFGVRRGRAGPKQTKSGPTAKA